MKRKRNNTTRIIRSAMARASMSVREMCHLAVIPVSTYMDHQRDERLTQQELKRIDRVLHFTDAELAQIIRG